MWKQKKNVEQRKNGIIKLFTLLIISKKKINSMVACYVEQIFIAQKDLADKHLVFKQFLGYRCCTFLLFCFFFF